jgi:c-di-GMP-binding flagellar brake protein YcgR
MPTPMPKAGQTSEQSRALTKPAEIRAAFKLFRDQRLPLSLRLKSQIEELPAMVLDVTESDLLLDRLRPSTNNRLLREAKVVTFTARHDGLYLFAADLPISEKLAKDGLPYFRTPLPRQILFQQRRRSERVSLPRRVSGQGARVQLTLNGRIQQVLLVDVSTGGCRIRIEQAGTEALKMDSVFKDCQVRLSRDLSFTTDAVIRHQAYNERTDQRFAGLEFLHLDIADRRRLERFIDFQMQRQRGRLTDSSAQ